MKNKNIYSLLIDSEEKNRSIFEVTIYGMILFCMAFSGWQFASHSAAVPSGNMPIGSNRAPVEMIAKVPAEQPVVANADTATASAL